MSSQVSLVQAPDAVEFIQTMRTDTGRRAFLGDATKHHGQAMNAITFAHNAMVDGVGKIAALADDPTRNDVLRHDAARQVANGVVGVLEQSIASFRAASANLAREGNEAIEAEFRADPSREAIQSEIRGWIREQARKEDGIRTIREAMNANSEIAAVIYHSPHFLLGLGEIARQQIAVDGIKRFLPRAWTAIEDSQALDKLADKYAGLTKRVRSSFYNTGLADQASRRVQV